MVSCGRAVLRTPGTSVMVGTGVGRGVVGRAVGTGVPVTSTGLPLTMSVVGREVAGGGVGGVVGGSVGGRVKTGGGSVGSGVGEGLSATTGWSGASGFLGCAST